MGNDAIKDVQSALQAGALKGSLTVTESGKDASVARLEGVDPSQISQLMHDEHGRCGGFAFHEDERSARTAISATARTAMTQLFADYTLDNTTEASALVAEVKAANILATISWMSSFKNRYYTTDTGVASAKGLRDRWAALAANRSDTTVELFTHTWKQPSVILTIKGSETPDEYVVIGGHLDSIAGWAPGPNTVAPGADDDASGIATLTEVMRAVLQSGFKPARSLVFMGYAAEEVGLRGSADIAKKWAKDGKRVVGVLQLDMTNYFDASREITIITDFTNAAQNGFVGELIDTYVKTKWSNIECGYACSDHASWTQNGFAASTPFEAKMGSDNPNIHTAQDTLENSDVTGEHALKFAKIGAAYVAELAKGSRVGTSPPPSEPTQETTTVSIEGSVAPAAELSYGPFTLATSSFSAELLGSGDADLYVRFLAAPTDELFDCRPYADDANESCSVTGQPGVQAFVRVVGYTASAYTLSVTY